MLMKELKEFREKIRKETQNTTFKYSKTIAEKQAQEADILHQEAEKEAAENTEKIIMNDREMNTFSFVDFNKNRKNARLLSLYGVYGLKNDMMIDDEKHIQGNQNLKDIIEKKEEGILQNNQKNVKQFEELVAFQQYKLEKLEGQENNKLSRIREKIRINQRNKEMFQQDMQLKFGLNKADYDFQQSLKKNQKIIFNDLSKQEREEFEKKKEQRLKQIEQEEQREYENQKAQKILQQRRIQQFGFDPEAEFEINFDSFYEMNHKNIKKADSLQNLMMMNEIERIRQNLFPKKQLNDMEKEFADLRAIDRSVLESENLQIDAIAKAKLLSKIQNFQQGVENVKQKNKIIQKYKKLHYNKEKVGRENIRETALQDELDQNNKLIERNFREKVEKRVAKSMVQDLSDKKELKKHIKQKERELMKSQKDSDDSSIDSQASRINFWKELKVGSQKKEKKKKFTSKKAVENPTVTPSPGNSINQSSYNYTQNANYGKLKQIQIIGIKSYEQKIEDLEYRLEQQRKGFQQETRVNKKSALNYAIIYFKNKSKELTQILTLEGIKMIEMYTFLRKNLIKRDEQLMMAARRNVQQELVISELRHFIEENIEPALQLIDEINQTNVQERYIKDSQDWRIKYIKPSLSLNLSLFQSTIMRMQQDTTLHELRQIIEELREELEYMKNYIEALRLKEDIKFKEVEEKHIIQINSIIKQHKEEIQDLQQKLKFKSRYHEHQMKQLKRLYEDEIFDLKEMVTKHKQLNEIESNIQQTIIQKQDDKIKLLIAEHKVTLNILRFPILYNKFKDSIEDFQKKETLLVQTRLNQLKERMYLQNFQDQNIEIIKEQVISMIENKREDDYDQLVQNFIQSQEYEADINQLQKNLEKVQTQKSEILQKSHKSQENVQKIELLLTQQEKNLEWNDKVQETVTIREEEN